MKKEMKKEIISRGLALPGNDDGLLKKISRFFAVFRVVSA